MQLKTLLLACFCLAAPADSYDTGVPHAPYPPGWQASRTYQLPVVGSDGKNKLVTQFRIVRHYSDPG